MHRLLQKAIHPIWRKPDFIVGGQEDPYLLRWFIIPRNRFFNIYLHKFVRDDDDRALHDHPWHSLSLSLWGEYWDITDSNMRLVRPLRFIFRSATHTHRVELFKEVACQDCGAAGAPSDGCYCYYPGRAIIRARPAWTLFITGPRLREWGFHCPQGWRHWREYCEPSDSGKVGRGCD
jgi:hypothetical protein